MTGEIENTEAQSEAPEVSESEDKARAQGWRPMEEYKGDPEKWVSADSFLKRADEELPIMRERTRKMASELAELKSTVKKFSEHHAKVEQIAYDRALADVKKQRREALAIGDAEGVEAAEEKIEELKELKPAPKKEAVAEIAPEVQAFVTANPWFQSEPKLAKYAEMVCGELQSEDPTRDLGDILKEVAKEVKSRFPEKFANAKRSAPPAVEGSGAVASGGKGAKTFANLPAEAKQACEKFLRAGLIKSKDDYLKHYDWS
jgi:hypothetical protein